MLVYQRVSTKYDVSLMKHWENIINIILKAGGFSYSFGGLIFHEISTVMTTVVYVVTTPATKIYHWLVVWNIFSFSHILGIVPPTDFHIFQRGWNHQPDHISYIIIIAFRPVQGYVAATSVMSFSRAASEPRFCPSISILQGPLLQCNIFISIFMTIRCRINIRIITYIYI